MANPTLNEEQLAQANALLAEIRARIKAVAGDDPALVFAYTRKLSKELNYDERGKPAKRGRFKKALHKAQGGKCAHCGLPLELKGSVADRHEAPGGYKTGNVDLIHAGCDQERQTGKRFA